MGRRTPVAAALVAVAVMLSTVLVAAPASAVTVKVTAKASATSARNGEGIWFTGTVHRGSKVAAGAVVGLRMKKSGATGWTTIATTTTRSSGAYTFPLKPTATARYYVRAAPTSSTVAVRSAIVTVNRTVGDRTLEARAKLLGTRVGAATGATKKLGRSSAYSDSTVTSVRYRSYTKGMLVEVRRAGTLRTWFVPDKIRDRLVGTGGVKGTFGLPRADATCTLIESGCTQQFSKVAAYASSTTKTASYQAGRTRRAQYLAVARSQVGYDEPSWRNSKYNRWVGGTLAWCGVFQSWVAAASGNPGVVPRRTTFPSFVSAVKEDLLTYSKNSTKHRPRAGTLVFFAFKKAHPKTASHVGVVLSVKGSTLTVVEGNSSKGAVFTDDRGVYVHTRSTASVLFYAEPDW